MKVIVDGMNVIGARPDGWWRDRKAARRSLVADLAHLVEGGDDVTVVFDGRARPDELEEASSIGVEVVFAPGGPNAADHVIEDLLAKQVPDSGIQVVTSDEALAGAARRLGAKVVGAGAFRASLELGR